MVTMNLPLSSCLYECTVFHRRLQPKQHEFHYRIFYLLIDLDELPRLDSTLRLLKVNRPGIYSIFESDHISHGEPSLKENIARYLRTLGFEQPPARILLLTLPRIFGYVFNPISIYFCYDVLGEPLLAVAEVGNTFLEWKPYPVHLASDGTFHSRTVKYFYVSPFSDLDLQFDFRFHQPGHRLRINIDDYLGDQRELVSMVSGFRVPLTDATLLRFTFTYPLLTLWVILSIHWQALRLWMKGLTPRRKEAEPELQLGVHRAHKSLANHPSSCAHLGQDDLPDNHS